MRLSFCSFAPAQAVLTMVKSIDTSVNATVRLSLSLFQALQMALSDFFPPTCLDILQRQLSAYPNTKIVTVPARRRKLGDYCQMPSGEHRITLNDNLSPFAMLLVLIHETAHLETRLRYGKAVQPHGKEWKETYSRLLKTYVYANVFPIEFADKVLQHAQKPSYCFPRSLLPLLEHQAE